MGRKSTAVQIRGVLRHFVQQQKGLEAETLLLESRTPSQESPNKRPQHGFPGPDPNLLGKKLHMYKTNPNILKKLYYGWECFSVLKLVIQGILGWARGSNVLFARTFGVWDIWILAVSRLFLKSIAKRARKQLGICGLPLGPKLLHYITLLFWIDFPDSAIKLYRIGFEWFLRLCNFLRCCQAYYVDIRLHCTLFLN